MTANEAALVSVGEIEFRHAMATAAQLKLQKLKIKTKALKEFRQPEQKLN